MQSRNLNWALEFGAWRPTLPPSSFLLIYSWAESMWLGANLRMNRSVSHDWLSKLLWAWLCDYMHKEPEHPQTMPPKTLDKGDSCDWILLDIFQQETAGAYFTFKEFSCTSVGWWLSVRCTYFSVDLSIPTSLLTYLYLRRKRLGHQCSAALWQY